MNKLPGVDADERRAFFRNLTPEAFAALGASGVAYIKAVDVDGEAAFAVHLADGRQIAVMADRALAEMTVRENALEPLSVH